MTQRKALAVIVAIGIALRVGATLVMGNTVVSLPGIEDQISYNTLALRVLHGHGFTFAQDWWPGTPAGEPTAHWSYLYTLALTALHAVSGERPLAARLAQAVLAGALTPLLIFRLAQRVLPAAGSETSPPAAPLIAAGWSAVYGYLVYYAAALMTEAFYILGILWVLDSSLRLAAAGRSRRAGWVELGAAILLTVLLRQVFLLFVVILLPVLILSLWRRDGRPGLGRAMRGGCLTALVVVAGVLPITAYNYQRFGRVVLLNTNAGYAFYWANHPIYGDRFVGILPNDGPTYGELVPDDVRSLNEAERDSALLARGLAFVVEDPGRYLRLSLSRIPIYFMFWPAPESQTLSNIVRVGSFGLALPLMLLGVGLWGRAALGGRLEPEARAGGGLLLLFASFYSLIHLLSWSLIRYRLPVDAVLLIFAGHGLAVAGQWVRGRRAAPPQPVVGGATIG